MPARNGNRCHKVEDPFEHVTRLCVGWVTQCGEIVSTEFVRKDHLRAGYGGGDDSGFTCVNFWHFFSGD